MALLTFLVVATSDIVRLTFEKLLCGGQLSGQQGPTKDHGHSRYCSHPRMKGSQPDQWYEGKMQGMVGLWP